MAFKCVILAALLAVANAGLLGGYAAAPVAYGAAPVAYGAAPVAYGAAPYAYGAVASPALVSQQSNILRTPGNLGQVSSYSKTINTPYSSVSKSDVRVSNDALAYHHAPAVAAYAAPALAHTYAAPALAHTYAAPALAHTYAAPALAHGYAAHGYAAPAIATRTYAAPAVAAGGLLGVAYSAAPAVAHMTYSNGYGISYAY